MFGLAATALEEEVDTEDDEEDPYPRSSGTWAEATA
jgi:hypothetical protein